MSNNLGYDWQDQDGWSRGGGFRSILRAQNSDLFRQTLATAQATTDVTVSGTTGAQQSLFGVVSFKSGSTPVLIELSASSAVTGAATAEFVAFVMYLDGSTTGTEIAVVQTGAVTAESVRAPVYARYRYEPVPGNHIVEVKVYRNTNNGTIYATNRAPILLTVTSDPNPRI